MTELGLPPETDPLRTALARLIDELPRDLPVACTPAAAELVERTGRDVLTLPLEELEDGCASAVLLIDDEVSLTGDRAEEFIARGADALRPAGTLVFTALRGTEPQPPRGRPAESVSPALRTEERLFDAAGVEHLLMHRGMAVTRLEHLTDSDGAERFLVAGTAPVSSHERSVRFIASLPFKLVTSAVVCRDAQGRLLCVFDTFRRHWTVPGGVVDAGEDPQAGAVREAVEEGGVRVRVTSLAGVFSTAVPDRLLMIYAAEPLDPDAEATLAPVSRQPQEIGDVRWVPVPEALELLNPRTRWQVQQCLDTPGQTWRE